MLARHIRVPTNNAGWATCVWGEPISRLHGLKIFLGLAPRQAKVNVQHVGPTQRSKWEKENTK